MQEILNNTDILFVHLQNKTGLQYLHIAYPEKLHFDGHQHRTTRITEVARLFY